LLGKSRAYERLDHVKATETHSEFEGGRGGQGGGIEYLRVTCARDSALYNSLCQNIIWLEPTQNMLPAVDSVARSY